MSTSSVPAMKKVRRLSWARLSAVALAVVLCAYAGVRHAETRWDRGADLAKYEPWFAPYVDVTSTPTYAFEKKDEIDGVVLAFIVAHPEKPCTPTWGGYYGLDGAAEALDLDRRIARLQQQGGKIAISFGGAHNSELALACTDEEALLDAYRDVVDRYQISTIDLDLENESLRSPEAATRRAIAIAALQSEYEEKNEKLLVWVTLPVAPQGLTKEGTDAIAALLGSGVDIAGVNLMTMDYGESRDQSLNMAAASEQALLASHKQLDVLYQHSGTRLSEQSLWSKLGATPMIGQNDVVAEVFTLEDAVTFNLFAQNKGLGRMSMWSANRDIPCGENYVDTKIVSDVCSGVTSRAGAFTESLRVGFPGDLVQQATMVTIDPEANTPVVDDPKTSPYQIWRDTGIYLKGTKVVWRGNVYEAKWWTKNDLPDNPVLQSWETPWQLVGPVLPTDKPMEKLVLPAYAFPKWSGQSIYDAGDRVLFDGNAFRAKWWNQGESPAAFASNPESSPWVPLTQEQIQEILRR